MHISPPGNWRLQLASSDHDKDTGALSSQTPGDCRSVTSTRNENKQGASDHLAGRGLPPPLPEMSRLRSISVETRPTSFVGMRARPLIGADIDVSLALAAASALCGEMPCASPPGPTLSSALYILL
ncbi:hypothetical protein AAFF_G00055760 [Aldrovandia affinis]|uniref:Uncharacterized protein n=1 Tax=Aldrovandia affinis TaxID=143900 RepID=A0AAD7S152_9TELE|nr:hypothetical protein AAFF_G00055760 [Aldrovandia affinis]